MNLTFRDVIERHLFLVYVLIALLHYFDKGKGFKVWELYRVVEVWNCTYSLGFWSLEWYLLGFLLIGYGLMWFVRMKTTYWISILQLILVLYVCFVKSYVYKESCAIHFLCVIMFIGNFLMFLIPYLTRKKHLPEDDLLDDNKRLF